MADNIVVSYKDNLDEIIAHLKEVKQLNVDFGKVVLDVSKKVDDLGKKSKEATEKTKQSTSELSNLFNKLGTQIAAAFSVGAIIAFGKATFEAFAEAELSAKKLQAAIGAQGGLQKDFNILLNQSKELQKQSIFSDEAIQGIQTLALQFGLSREAVQKLTPEIIDFASATGQDLNSALSAVLRGIEGQARGLKVYGVEISTTGTRAEKFASIMEQLNQKFAGQGRIVADTAAGKLKQLSNAWNDLEETIGAAIAPLVAGAASLARSLIGITEVPLSKKLEEERINLEQTTIKLSSLNEGSKERSLIIAQLQSQYPGYLDNIKGEELSNEALQKALRKVNDQLVLKIALAKGDEQITDAQEKVADALLKTSKQEGILISQIRQRLEQAQKSNPVLAEELKTRLQGLSLDEQAILIQKSGLDVSGKIIESVQNRQAAEAKLKIAQVDLTAAQKKRIEEEQRLRGILNIPPEEEKKTGKTGLEKKTEAELKAEADAAKKLRDQQIKDAKERLDATASLRKQALSDELDNITAEETARKSAAAKEIADQQELDQVLRQIEIEQDLKRRAAQIDFGESTVDIDKKIGDEIIANQKANQKEITDNVKEGLDERIKAIKDAEGKELLALSAKGLSNEKFEREKLLLTKRTLEAEVEAYKKAGKDIGELLSQLGDVNQKLAEGTKKNFLDVFRKIEEAAQSLLDSLNNLFNAQDEADISRINKNKDTRVQSIDDQIKALEDANEKGKLSDKKLEEQKKVLLKEREAAEKKALQEQNKIKRQEAEREKLLSLFRIGLILAEAIAEVNVFKIISAAAELAIVAATPIPEFKKGTTKEGTKKTGLGLVGEEGPELLWMPQGSKVVTAEKTRKYKDAIDSMIEGTFDEKYVYKAMIASALREAGQRAEKQKQKSFAENIAQLFNVKAEVDPYRLADGIKSNNKELAWYIGKAVAKNLSQGYKNHRYH